MVDANGNRLGRRFCKYQPGYDEAAACRDVHRAGSFLFSVCSGNAYTACFIREFLPSSGDLFPSGAFREVAPVYGDMIAICPPLVSLRSHGRSLSVLGLGVIASAKRFAIDVIARRKELPMSLSHVSKQGVVLPITDLLDSDLVFINYRLLALNCGQSYDGAARDSIPTLCIVGMAASIHGATPLHTKLNDAGWLRLLALLPALLARQLIAFRYARDKYICQIRRRFSSAFGVKAKPQSADRDE